MSEGKPHKFLPAKRDKTPEPSGFVFPGPTDRVTINGMTGTGKSTFALWLFGECADFDKKPWIFIDYKGEDLINEAVASEYFKVLSLSKPIPREPGIFVVRPHVRAGQGPVSDFLWKIYEAGRCGVFLDEATMIPELRGEGNSGGPFQSLLSQGRSKQIPVWVLAQRPVNVNRMVYSESQYYCAFDLGMPEDLKKIKKEGISPNSRNYEYVWGDNWEPPKHWSRWYDRERKISFRLHPCPPPNEIMDIIGERVDNLKKRETI